MLRFEKDVHRALWGHEEWLVCAHPSAPGRIVGGEGKTLRDVCPGFPLLVKKICAKDRLSVQVHPNDETAKTVGGEPKTEMWCVLEPGPIFAGFRPGVTKQDVERAVADGTFEELLVRFDAKRGECYFIPGGLVHAIGEGTSVYEVQQSSDTTYRFYDWDRKDKEGRKRPLHIEESFRSLDYTIPPPRVHQKDVMNTPFFRMRVVPLPYALTVRTDGSSFVAGFVLSGATDLAACGESFLIPATAGELRIRPAAPNTRVILTEL